MERGKIKLISRLLWERKNGYYLPREVVLRHTCDNPWCINLDHLITGTLADNVQDAVDRGRMAKGQRAGPSVLTDKQVKDIKILLAFGVSCYFISKWIGIGAGAIQWIQQERNWKHLILKRSEIKLNRRLKKVFDAYSNHGRSRPTNQSYRKFLTMNVIND